MTGARTNLGISQPGLLWLQASDFQQGQAQVADDVQEAMQGGLVDDVPGEDGFARLVPAHRESPEPVRPLRSQSTQDTDTVTGRCRQHRDPLLKRVLGWEALPRSSGPAAASSACGPSCWTVPSRCPIERALIIDRKSTRPNSSHIPL